MKNKDDVKILDGLSNTFNEDLIELVLTGGYKGLVWCNKYFS